MVKYPHTLTVYIPGTTTRESDGDYVAANATTTTYFCREEPNGGGASITLSGGEFYRHTSMIYLPPSTPALDTGLEVEVTDINGVTRVKGTIMRFSKDTKHCRLWL